ncbi:Tetratricopeptide repeat protein 28 [Exaiptasia diaphana]|nr:Tetratricopeptide repeat protein 28 [Exaiptasia diaphana]
MIKMMKIVFPVKDNNPDQFRFVEEPLGEFITSIKHHQRRLKDLEEDDDEKASILTFIGLAYYKLGSYSQSITYFEDLVSVAQSLGDRKTLGHAYTNLGCIHRTIGNITQALEYFDKSLALARDRDDQLAIAKNLNNIGNIYEIQHHIEDAVDCHEERLQIARSLGDLDGLCKACGCLGSLYLIKGHLYNSISRYEELLDALRTKLRIQVVLADDNSDSDGEVDLDEIAYDMFRDQMEALNKKNEKKDKSSLTQKVRQTFSNIGFLAKSVVKQ